MNRALYLNKFGIMHLGLVELVKDIESNPEVDEIILGICSSQFSDKNKSPEKQGIYNCLDCDERINVMKASLKNIKKPIIYVPIEDHMPIIKTVPENPWIDEVISLVPDFNILYSERNIERICMQHKGKKINNVVKRVAFTDHCIRDKIARSEIWEPYFVSDAVNVLKNMNIEERYKKLFENLSVDSDDVDFEWRIFDSPNEFKYLNSKLNSLELVEFREPYTTIETYILSLTRSSINLKSRQNNVRIKELLKSSNGIEQWKTYNIDFPIFKDDFTGFLRKKRFPVSGDLPDVISSNNFNSYFPDYPNPYLMQVPVEKTRHMYLYEKNNLRVGLEIDTIKIFNDEFISFAVESKNAENITKVLSDLNITRTDQKNYIQFLEQKVVEKYGNKIFENMILR